MFPLLVYYAELLLPSHLVTSIFALGIPILSPYLAILAAFTLVYVPFSIKLVHVSMTGSVDVVEPRKQTQNLGATSRFVARLQACHDYLQECFPFIAAGVLGALQAGVSAQVVAELASLWVWLRVLYCVLYIFGVHQVIAILRMLHWVATVIVQSKLFWLAAHSFDARKLKH